MNISDKIPEIKSSQNAGDIPWETSVVWRGPDGIYEWIEDRDIRYVSWVSGIVSIIPSSDSFLSNQSQAILLSGTFVWVGAKVKVG